LADHPLIDRQFLEKLERLALRWQKSFAGLVGGQAPSRHAGSGQEFLDHRQFHHGDDLRSVNWRAYLRFEKLFMKMFHIEPRIPVRLMLDVSLSMSTSGNSKFRYARRLTAALCYVGLVRLESITVLPFHDRLEDAFICSGGRHRFGPVADFLTGLQASGTTRFNDVVRQLTSKYAQRGLLIVISDFLGEESFERPLELAADLGHELFLVQLWDEEDRTPPWRGSLEIVEAESGETRQIEFDKDARERYTHAFDEHARALQRVAASSGGRYAGFSTQVALEDAIFGPLSQVGGIE
jgi:uncharacterized protein (DUF58 family)